jgi:hypothetical protein
MEKKPIIVYQDNMSTMYICNVGFKQTGKDLKERGIIGIN